MQESFLPLGQKILCLLLNIQLTNVITLSVNKKVKLIQSLSIGREVVTQLLGALVVPVMQTSKKVILWNDQRPLKFKLSYQYKLLSKRARIGKSHPKE